MSSQNFILGEKQEKEKRLTKKQSAILLIVSILITIITRQFIGGDSILATSIDAAGTLTFIFALISLLTKDGLRWK